MNVKAVNSINFGKRPDGKMVWIKIAADAAKKVSQTPKTDKVINKPSGNVKRKFLKAIDSFFDIVG